MTILQSTRLEGRTQRHSLLRISVVPLSVPLPLLLWLRSLESLRLPLLLLVQPRLPLPASANLPTLHGMDEHVLSRPETTVAARMERHLARGRRRIRSQNRSAVGLLLPMTSHLLLSSRSQMPTP